MDSSSCLDRFLSETSSTVFPPLPPATQPYGRPQSKCFGDWGTSIIYDLSSTPENPSPKASAMKTVRKSLLSNLELHKLSSEDELDIIDFWYLPIFQATMFATIQEEIILKMRILFECNNPLRVIKALSEMLLLLDLKFSVEQAPNTDPLQKIDSKNLSCDEYKLNKLNADKKKILSIITRLYIELLDKKCYSALLDFVNAMLDQEKYAIYIVEEKIKNKSKRKELFKKLTRQRNYHKAVVYAMTNTIVTLRTQIEDDTFLTEIKGRYVDNWQEARTRQHKLIFKEKEDIYTNSMEYFKRRAEHESRVHAEIEIMTNAVINQTLKDTENWMDKYETEIEQMDYKIQIQKLKWLEVHEERIKLEKEFKLHARQIKDWVKFKDMREKERAYETNMIKSAIIVQAWWRGLLVRKKLGPYRLQLKKRKKEKKK